MKTIAIGLGFLAFVAVTEAAAQSVAITDVGAAVADTMTMPKGLELLRPGALVRASFSPCGDPDRGTTQLTGTFLELQPGAFAMSTIEPDNRTLTHQVAIDDRGRGQQRRSESAEGRRRSLRPGDSDNRRHRVFAPRQQAGIPAAQHGQLRFGQDLGSPVRAQVIQEDPDFAVFKHTAQRSQRPPHRSPDRMAGIGKQNVDVHAGTIQLRTA